MSSPVNPLALLQSRLGTMIGTPSGYVDTLPKPMKRRIKALKKLQLDSISLDAELAQEVLKLEMTYAKKYDAIWAKRREIITGKYEPNDEECDFPSPVPSDTESLQSDGEDGEGQKKSSDKQGGECTEVIKSEADTSGTSEPPAHGFTDETPGLPEFWLTIFKNIEPIGVNIQDHDEKILANLTDITLQQSLEPLSFTLEFHFAPNEYFTNSVLTKTYELSCDIDAEDPFSFEGIEIKGAKGCKIDWKEGKNVTVKTVTKKQKHKTKGSVRCVPKQVKADSFFNFFDPIILPEDDDDLSIDEDTQALFQADLEMGELIKQRIIPRAVLYFTGEALEDDDEDDEYDDEEDDEEEDDDEDDEDDEDSGDNDTAKNKKVLGKAGPRGPKRAGGQPGQPECKQQ